MTTTRAVKCFHMSAWSKPRLPGFLLTFNTAGLNDQTTTGAEGRPEEMGIRSKSIKVAQTRPDVSWNHLQRRGSGLQDPHRVQALTFRKNSGPFRSETVDGHQRTAVTLPNPPQAGHVIQGGASSPLDPGEAGGGGGDKQLSLVWRNNEKNGNPSGIKPAAAEVLF